MARSEGEPPASPRGVAVRRLRSTERGESALAPSTNLGVDVHPVPVLGAIPADFILAEALPYLRRACRTGEVDQVYVLVPRAYVFELHARRPAELHGVLHVLAPLPDELDFQAGLFEDLAQRGLVGELFALYVPPRGEPHAELAMQMQQHLAPPHHEHRDRKVPTRVLRLHGSRVQHLCRSRRHPRRRDDAGEAVTSSCSVRNVARRPLIGTYAETLELDVFNT